ncbi:MAG: SCO family protein [Phycisphaerae bacterium]|nr:SCO family protein [Phycisphaerae bacterium]
MTTNLVLAIAVALLAASPVRAQVIRKDLPPDIKGLETVEKPGQRIPLDLPLVDSSGATIKVGDVFNQGRPVILALVYYRCPMLCTMVTDRLKQSLNDLDWTVGEAFNVLFVSFDPNETSLAATKAKSVALAAYNRDENETIRAGWRFATGTVENTKALAESVGFKYRYLPDSGEFSHNTVIFVLTPDGRVSRYLYGVEYPTRTLRMALLEASEGKIGTTLDRLYLFCYHYDPSKGVYVLQAMRVMQVGGAASALAIGGLLAWMLLVVEPRRRAARARPPVRVRNGTQLGVLRGTGAVGLSIKGCDA